MYSGLGEAAHRCPARGCELVSVPTPRSSYRRSRGAQARTVERERARGSTNKSAVLRPVQGRSVKQHATEECFMSDRSANSSDRVDIF